MENVNRDELCGALIEKEDFWVCVWGSRDKPPVFQKLSKKLDEARKICDVCMASRLPDRYKYPKFYLFKAAFKCNQCEERVLLEQIRKVIKYPVECPQCGFREFEFIQEESTFISFDSDGIFSGSKKI